MDLQYRETCSLGRPIKQLVIYIYIYIRNKYICNKGFFLNRIYTNFFLDNFNLLGPPRSFIKYKQIRKTKFVNYIFILVAHAIVQRIVNVNYENSSKVVSQ